MSTTADAETNSAERGATMIVRGSERTAGEMTGMTGEEEGINLRKRTVNSILNYNINLLKPCNTILYSFYCK